MVLLIFIFSISYHFLSLFTQFIFWFFLYFIFNYDKNSHYQVRVCMPKQISFNVWLSFRSTSWCFFIYFYISLLLVLWSFTISYYLILPLQFVRGWIGRLWKKVIFVHHVQYGMKQYSFLISFSLSGSLTSLSFFHISLKKGFWHWTFFFFFIYKGKL